MPLINCKVELKLKWTNYCVFSAVDPVSLLHFFSKGQLKTIKSKGIAKDLKDQFIAKNTKQKVKIKKMTNEYRYFPESNFAAVNRLFVLIYSSQDNNVKRYNVLNCYLPKGIIKNYNIIINGMNFSNQSVDSNIKQCEEIRKLTTGQDEDYTTVCLLDYDYIKNYYRLIAVDLSKQKDLDADPKAIYKVEFTGK